MTDSLTPEALDTLIQIATDGYEAQYVLDQIGGNVGELAREFPDQMKMLDCFEDRFGSHKDGADAAKASVKPPAVPSILPHRCLQT